MDSIHPFKYKLFVGQTETVLVDREISYFTLATIFFVMGRQKLKIAKLENSSSRRITFGKRMNGIAKKVKDLAHLCDVDVAVLMFHPNGRKATLCLGENR